MATVTFTTLTNTNATDIKAIETNTGANDTISGAPSNLVVSNADESGDSCTFDLFLTDGTYTYYILRSTEVPAGVALVLEGLELEYNTTVYALKAQMDSSAGSRQLTIKATYE